IVTASAARCCSFMLKIASRIDRRVPAARSAAKDDPYSTIRRSPRWYQTRCGMWCTSGCAPVTIDERQTGVSDGNVEVAWPYSPCSARKRSAGASTTSAAKATSAAVPPRVPPRRSAPRTTCAEPSAPARPPIPPPSASSQSSRAKPRATPAAAARRIAATTPPRTVERTPVKSTPKPAPTPTSRPIQYHSPTCSSLVRPFRRTPSREKRLRGARRRSALARLLLLRALWSRATHGEPARAPRAQGARPHAISPGRRRPAARPRCAVQGRRGADARPRQGQTDHRAPRRPRLEPPDRADDRGAPRAPRGLAGLQPTNDVEPEGGGAGAVNHAVVERDRDVADRRGSHPAVADDRPLGDPAHAQDGDLGVVHDRRLEEAGDLARARHRERGAAQLLGCQLS